MFFMTKAVMRHFKNGGNIITRLFLLVFVGVGWANFLFLRHSKEIFAARECLSLAHLRKGGGNKRKIAKILLTAG